MKKGKLLSSPFLYTTKPLFKNAIQDKKRTSSEKINLKRTLSSKSCILFYY